MCLNEISNEIIDLMALLKAESKLSTRKEILKSIEDLVSLLILCIESIERLNIKFLETFFEHELSYIMIQLSEFEEDSLSSLNLTFFTLTWNTS